ncbi:ParB/RepB/Spo0J family partition protein [Flavisphingomonas formosensis]|uniref:ParB/RepB/Spo0J family partition protein n=1 Tax=Flavisphingomonas formosensis TaxID=861534 RepID=UPI0012F73908|nr:ParB/RepB/Spo0J family partition protein [Sphingomonas formosensis]
MTQLPILVAASKLTKSPTNVRKTSDPDADAQLEANIAERGIIQNLVGLPVARKKGHYRITAGGRRLDCVQRLIEAGTLDADYLVPVLVLADAKDAIEISLSENFFRLAMNPAEACRAFQDIIETEGKTPADVAKRFGLTERFVLGRLRLASLAQPVFDALAAGEISLDVAIAYASTSDIERQAAVFTQMTGNYYRNNVGEIRRQLASFSYRANDPRALLVGRDAYIEAGGRIDRDLFSDADTEAWLDTHIVDQLAEEKLVEAAAIVRERDGFAEVRIVSATHIPYSDTYELEPLRGDPVPLTDAEEARQVELEAAIAAIEEESGDEELSEEEESRLQSLESELSAIADRVPLVSDEQRSQAVAYIVIGQDGSPRLHEQLYIAPAAEEPADEDEGDAGASEEDAPATPTKAMISQRLADELAMMKTELIAVHVAGDPLFAIDLGTFLMVDAASRSRDVWAIPSDLRATAPSPRVAGFVSETRAASRWSAIEEGLDRSWLDHEEIEGRYDAFCALADESRAAWLGWAIARTLHAVPAGKAGSSFLDHLGRKLGIAVAHWWRPTARTYFDRISKPTILSLFEDIGGSELRHRYAAAKKHDLAASAERLFAGDMIMEADGKERALAWLPPQMRFDVADDVPAVVRGEEAVPQPDGTVLGTGDAQLGEADQSETGETPPDLADAA